MPMLAKAIIAHNSRINPSSFIEYLLQCIAAANIGFKAFPHILYDIQCAQLQEIIRYNTVVVRTVTAYVYLTILQYIVASSWRGEFQR